MKTHSDENSRTATVEAPANISQNSPADIGWGHAQEELSGSARWRVPLLICIVLMGVIGFAARILSKKSGATVVQKEPPVVDVTPFRPTPEPVQPTPTPPPQSVEVLIPPDPPDAEPDPVPPPAITTGNPAKGTGDGPLVFDRNPRPFVLVQPRGTKGHPEWTAYSSMVNARIRTALQNDSRTRKMNLEFSVRVWPDAIGRITRAEFEIPTGDPKTDAIIIDEILKGLQIAQPPPAGMPAFIRMKVTARRPN